MTRAALALLLLLPSLALADEPTAHEIMTKAREFQFPENATAEVRMVLTNSRGSERVRAIKMWRKSYGEGRSKMLARFLDPADVKGTGFLLWQNEAEGDDMFMYLPSLKKTRRLSSEEDEQSFMGSDFSNGDMKIHQIEKDEHKLLRSETLAGKECWVIESTPKNPEGEQYVKYVAWVRKDNYVPIQTQLFKKAGDKPAKTMRVLETRMIDGALTVTHFQMRDEKQRSKTDMVLENVTLAGDIDDEMFTKQSLERL